MLTARYERFGGEVAVVTLPDPMPTRDGVVIQVAASGVCRSDWHAWQGHDDDVSLPHVPGHEFAGTVVAAGPDVRSVATGMRVVVPFILGCGACRYCAAGDAQICPWQVQPGFHLPGSFAEYVAIPRADFNVVPLPDEVTFLAAASLGCRYTTAWRAVVERAALARGERLAVFGCGGVGLAAIQIAAHLGAGIFAVDPDSAAASHAEALGATVVEQPPEDLDVVLDAIGHPGVATAAIPHMRPGGRFVQVGILEGDGMALLPLNRVMRNEVTVMGSHGMAARGIPELLDLVADGSLQPEQLVTDRTDLAGGIEHLRHMPGRPGRVVVIEGFGHAR